MMYLLYYKKKGGDLMGKKKKKNITELLDSVKEILNMEQFRWVIIDGEVTDYIISSYGYLISVKKNKNAYPKRIIPWRHKDHLYVSICIDGKRKHYQLHRLVAIAFLPNPDNKPIVHHIDKNPINNCIDNLMWVTESEHKYIHKDELVANREPKYGSDCNLSVYSDAQIRQVCKYLEENKKNIKEITSLTGVKHDTICRILNRNQWIKISNDYDITHYNVKTPKKDTRGANSPSAKYTEAQVRLVCEMLESGKKYAEIEKVTGVSKTSIGHIKLKTTWTHISSEYNI